VTTWASNDFIVYKNMALPDGLLSCQTAPIAIAARSQAEGVFVLVAMIEPYTDNYLVR